VTSVITDAPLQATPRKSDQPYANCLYYAQGKCRKCEERCPANAINKDGHDKLKCDLYGRVVEKEMTQRLRKLLKPHYYRIDDKDN
jgi:epoxyqueuosine reductase QueG